ncbi:MAG: hypothetical protein KKD44_29170 [Proteobacteria bacterium]|nr:hypothetical protein [Pseudomonadota bacterium]
MARSKKILGMKPGLAALVAGGAVAAWYFFKKKKAETQAQSGIVLGSADKMVNGDFAIR